MLCTNVVPPHNSQEAASALCTPPTSSTDYHMTQRTYKLRFSPVGSLVLNHIADLLHKGATEPSPPGSYELDLMKKPYAPKALNQLNLGACASHSAANCYFYLLGKEHAEQFHPSRLALYYNTRVLIENLPAKED